MRKRTHRPKPDPEATELQEAAARIFDSADGDKVLAHLRRLTKERVVGFSPQMGEVTGRALLHLEGQRYIVHLIESWIAKGNDRDPDQYRTERARFTASERGDDDVIDPGGDATDPT